MHIPIIVCCGMKRVLFTRYWCHNIIKLYLFTMFHASNYSGKRVIQTCMPYCKVWAEVTYRGFPKHKVFRKINMLIPCASPNSKFHIMSVLRLVSKRKRKTKRRRLNNSQFDTVPIVKNDPVLIKHKSIGLHYISSCTTVVG